MDEEPLCDLTVYIRGSAYSAPDGRDRQLAYRQLRIGQPLGLKHEPDTPGDSNAIAFYDATGFHLGYVPADFAPRLKADLDRGCWCAVEVVSVQRDTRYPDRLIVVTRLRVFDRDTPRITLQISVRPPLLSSLWAQAKRLFAG